MLIALRWDGPARAWHENLGKRLEERGHAFVLRPRAPRAPASRDLQRLFAIERRLYGATSSLFAEIDLPRDDEAGALELTILFDGVEGEAVLLDALLRHHVPTVTVQRRAQLLVTGLPANEEPLILSRGLDQVLTRIIGLVMRAVAASETSQSSDGVRSPAPVPTDRRPASVMGFAARSFADKLAGRMKGHADHWSIALRRAEEVVDLPDDGTRFFADPFLFEHLGRMHLFFEDFPYATQKGVISRLEVGADGRLSPSRLVLEQPFHLSYPFVIEHGGTLYMLPETSGARCIQLYRADPFPDHWVPDFVLVKDVVAGDATPILHRGRWWLFTTIAGDGGSSWDQLSLFSAPDLLGPWRPHEGNPVLVDAGAARPAGAMWHEDGVLMRVAQDCRAGYGAGLAVCRVDRLDDHTFAQTVIERIGPPGASGATGLHTRNRLGGLEVVDLKWKSPRRRATS